MPKRSTIAVAAGIALIYAACIVVGLHLHTLAWNLFDVSAKSRPAWQPPHTLPAGRLGESVRLGQLLFNQTSSYAPDHVSAKLSCASCHVEGGIQPYASPMVGLPALFPMFNARAGHVISLPDRIEECFVRSENGTPIPYDSAQMHALVDYIGWLSQPEPGRRPFVGRGFLKLATLQPDRADGAAVYADHCAGCHAGDGRGRLPAFPPLWGPESFNDGAGMNDLPRLAAFIQHNMPQNRSGILTPQQAWDVAAYLESHPRPAFNPAYKGF